MLAAVCVVGQCHQPSRATPGRFCLNDKKTGNDTNQETTGGSSLEITS
jgi:hypothetical protein